MSEENEHTSEEVETEMSAENHSKEQSKNETSMINNETEQPMLEDEEMPTYISVSSPSRREDSSVTNAKQQDTVQVEEDHSRSPYPSDDQGGGSIYVVSSGEESTHPYNDEDEDDYADSEDEMDLENDHENAMLDDDEEEDEDDDDDDGNPLRLHNDDDEDMDTDYEQECFDRASDDFVLNTRLKHHHKERSLSLQDLSISRSNAHSPYTKKRHSWNIFRHNHLNLQPNPIAHPFMHKKQMVPQKYQHVESKVKQYIRDIKEQSRRSLQRRMKEHELLMNRNLEGNEDYNTEQLKVRSTSKTIKDYAEKAIKDLQQEENEDDNLIYSAAQTVENGENNRASKKAVENQYKNTRKDTDYSDIKSEKRIQSDDKLEKRNGSIDVNTNHIEYQNTMDRNMRFNSMNQSSLVNGHQQAPAFINLRTLSYEEYMHGTSSTEQKEELSEQRHEKPNGTDEYNEAEIIHTNEIDNSNTSCSLKISSVKSIRVIQDESENIGFVKMNTADRMNAENTVIMELKAQLSRKNAQFHNLREAYQKTLAENTKMKQELHMLKKSLTKNEGKSKSCEMKKTAAVQTEEVALPASNQDTVTSGDTNNKISSSSVASTVSSVDQWAESAYSPAISVKPPDLTPILNSDDSMVLTDGITPRKLPHPLSRTFITSSRILQTLSSITQGKTKAESPLAKNSKKRLNENPTDQILNLDCNSPIQASSSKKRKTTDVPGSPTFVQPFKIPHTVTNSERRNSTDTSNIEFKYSEEHTSSKVEQKENTSVNKDIKGSTSAEAKREDTNDNEGSVKCFIYKDGENSKNRSFLIQAEEPVKDRLDNEKNRIQECGPYLLGNIEVRMSEINGTISVWGKEINEECASDDEDDMDVSVNSFDKKTCHCYWPNSSQSRFNGSQLVCSTNKKQKAPLRFNKSNVYENSHYLPLNIMKTPSTIDDVSDKKRMSNPCSPNICVPSCENCGSSKCHKEWSTCKGASSSREKLHSCCTHAENIDKEYNCGSYSEKEKHGDSLKCCKDKFHIKGNRKNSYKNTCTPETKNHLHEKSPNFTAERCKVACKYHNCRHSFLNVVDNCLCTKGCNAAKDVSCTYKSSSDNISSHESSDKHTCSHSLSNDCEEDPLIPPKKSNETPETRQRRLSGKRVRGILMDLLKGCGDCRSSSASGLNKSGFQQKRTPHTVNSPPQIKVSPASIPEPTCSSSTQCNDRCCHAYARRIESQLEEFRMEMERVRSRSDAILDMLNMLHSVDMN